MSKWREYWIYKHGDGDTITSKDPDDPSFEHVIEHGALREAEERSAKLVDELAVKTHLADCRDTVYRAEIAVLTDALKYYAGQGYTAKCIEGGKVAREALAELSKAQNEPDDFDKMLKMIDRMTEGRDD